MDIKKQLKMREFLLLSCAQTFEIYITQLRDWLLNFAKNATDVDVLLDVIDRDLFIEIGVLGIREPILGHAEESVMVQTAGAVEQSVMWEHKDPLQEQPTESITKKASRLERDSRNILGNRPPLTIPDTSSDPQGEKDIELTQQFMMLPEVQEIFETVAEKHNREVQDLEKETKQSLINLSKRGVISYFPGEEQLDRYVFNNVSTLINVLCCVFHHDLRRILTFDNIPFHLQEQWYQRSERRFKMDLEELDRFGILSRSLLQVFLTIIRCEIEVEVVAKLLQKLDVGINIMPDTDTRRLTLVPFLVRQTIDEKELQDHLDAINQCSGNKLSLDFFLQGNFVDSFFHQLLVKIYKKFGQNSKTNKKNHAWRHGVWLTLPEKDVKMMVYWKEERQIHFVIQGDVSKKIGHDYLWECIDYVMEAAKDLQESGYQGLVLDFILKCTECRIMKRSSEHTHEWDIGEIKQKNPVPKYVCEYCDEPIPAALLSPLPKGSDIKNIAPQ